MCSDFATIFAFVLLDLGLFWTFGGLDKNFEERRKAGREAGKARAI